VTVISQLPSRGELVTAADADEEGSDAVVVGEDPSTLVAVDPVHAASKDPAARIATATTDLLNQRLIDIGAALPGSCCPDRRTGMTS
jgi:hypothetical protein